MRPATAGAAMLVAVMALVAGFAAADAPGFRASRSIAFKSFRQHAALADKIHAFSKGAATLKREMAAQQTITQTTQDPRCGTEFYVAQAGVYLACPTIEYAGQVLFDISNDTTQAYDVINSFCASGCQSAVNAALERYKVCFGASTYTETKQLLSMCSVESGQYCATRVRSINRIECDDLNYTACGSPKKSCRFNNQTQRCEMKPTTSMLQEVCTGCFDKYILMFRRIVQYQPAEVQGLLQSAIIGLKDAACAKSGSTYCAIVADGVDDRIFDLGRTNNMSLAEVQQNISAACATTDTRRCINIAIAAQTNLMKAELESSAYFNCRYSGYSTSSRCAVNYATTLQALARVEALVSGMCNTNDRDEYCLSVVQSLTRHNCSNGIEQTNTCNQTCATWLQGATRNTSCCVARLQSAVSRTYRYLDVPSYLRAYINNPQATLAPAPTSNATTTATAPNATAIWMSNLWYNDVAVCNRSNVTFNASAARQWAERKCAEPAPVSRTLKVPYLRFDYLERNPAVKEQVKAACERDLFLQTGMSVVCEVLPDNSTVLYTAGTTRRQTTANTTVGVKLVFNISGATSADISAAASAFDAAVATRSLQLTNTADAVDSCSNCLAPPTAAPGQTPAPVPTGNLFALLAGSDTSGTNSPSSVTSAASSAFAGIAGAVAAAVVLAMAL